MTNYIEEVFGAEGMLSRQFDGYVPRAGQIEMAKAVDASLRDRNHLMVEAPTGVGKSLAYSVPAVHYAVNEDKCVLIATANIALQEQLVEKDLPLLKQILPWEFSFKLLKGRSNYLCRRRLKKVQGSYEPEDLADAEMYHAVLEWARDTNTGDISELPFEPPYRLWQHFSANTEDCAHVECKQFEKCFAENARLEAEEAHVVVVNYHLLFAHLQVKHRNSSQVLPSYQAVILDEAHKTADIARDFFGIRMAAGSVIWTGKLLNEIAAEEVHKELKVETLRFFARLEKHRASSEYKCRLKRPDVVPWRALKELLLEISGYYCEAIREVELGRSTKELERLSERCKTQACDLMGAMGLHDENSVVFVELDGRGETVLRSKVVDVSKRLQKELFGDVGSVILTSATMTSDRSFEHMKRELGVPEPRTLVVQSPFDYEKQALLVVPDGLPDPTKEEYSDAVAEAVAQIVELAEGRTLALFTSYNNLNRTYERLRTSGHRVLRQGEQPRNALVAEFRKDVNSVLLGTESFWAGVDVQGEALSCVIIDRLPFTSPEDPVLDAISERDSAWFANYSLPRSVIAFKQGFGRLIRSAGDRGVVVVLDNRLVKKRYGRAFTDSLPSVLKSRRIESVRRFLEAS